MAVIAVDYLVILHCRGRRRGPGWWWLSKWSLPARVKELAHIPLERGGAQGERGRRRWCETGPHPSEEGRGGRLAAFLGFWGRMEVARGKVVVVGWVENERNSTVMGLM
jgi:hypothetical protein